MKPRPLAQGTFDGQALLAVRVVVGHQIRLIRASRLDWKQFVVHRSQDRCRSHDEEVLLADDTSRRPQDVFEFRTPHRSRTPRFGALEKAWSTFWRSDGVRRLSQGLF